VAILRVNEHVDARAEHLRGHVVAEQRREGRVGVDEAPVVGWVDGDGVRRVLDEVAEARLAQLERVLRLVTLGDVVDDGRHAHDTAGVVHQRRIVPVAEDDPSVLPQVAVDAALAAASRQQRAEDVEHRLTRRGGNEQLEGGLAQGLRLAPSEDACRGVVPLDDAPLRIEPHHAERAPANVEGEALLGGLQRALGPRAVGHVLHEPHSPDDGRARVSQRRDTERQGDGGVARGGGIAPLVEPRLPLQGELQRRQQALIAQGAHVEPPQQLRA
jgi:hypothetical protein